jgi:hypothetical protein
LLAEQLARTRALEDVARHVYDTPSEQEEMAAEKWSLFMEPILCPLCTRYSLERLFDQVRLTARIGGESLVSGILAFRCTENSHVFFVRQMDVEAASEFDPSDRETSREAGELVETPGVAQDRGFQKGVSGEVWA